MWNIRNKILTVLLLVITVLLVLDYTVGSEKQTSLPDSLLEVDTSQIYKIVFFPNNEQEKQVVLRKEQAFWFVKTEKNKYPADRDKVQFILETLAQLRPTQVVADNPKQWQEYGVIDTSSLNILIFDNRDKELGHLFAGRIKSSDVSNTYAMGQNQQFYTYVRRKGDKKVYLVPKLLALTFVNDPKAYCDKTIINLDQAFINSISLKTVQDSFNLLRQGHLWKIDGKDTDSLKVYYYLRDISHVEGKEYVDEADIANMKVLNTLVLNTDIEKQVIVRGFGDTVVSVIWSSQNPDVYFKAQGLSERLFRDRLYFISKSEH